jgi:hypothetical protein
MAPLWQVHSCRALPASFWPKTLPVITVLKLKTILTNPYSRMISDLVWFEDFAPLGKNPKLTPKWQGPAKITEINDTNARLQLPNGKTKIYNIMRLKKFFAPNTQNANSETDTRQSDLDFKSEPKITGPVTRAMKRLMQQKKRQKWPLACFAIYLKSIVQCVNGNRNFPIIRCFLTLCLLDTTLQNEKVGSLTNNPCVLGANYNLVNI